ncbi:MAG: radical SAM protein [Prevotellaceae bacterium]|nr:radical SAM protein [Prevotellaceae bacterium]
MNILLITPPLTQLNTPYPATAVLKGYLKSIGHTVSQMDLGIELVCRLYTRDFLSSLFEKTAEKKKGKKSRRIFEDREQYIQCVEPVIRFLQGEEKTLSTRIANRTLLPEGPRFDNLADTEWAFGVSGTEDKARYLATLFIEDIADYIRETESSYFDLIKYAESLASNSITFDDLDTALKGEPDTVDRLMLTLLKERVDNINPQMVGFSVPFPGCLYTALRCGDFLKKNYKNITVEMGGGYPNTELRNLADNRIFQHIDFITLDDGELPLERLSSFISGTTDKSHLVRTFYLDNGQITYSGNEQENIEFSRTGTPDFSELPMNKYLSMTDMVNPMHKLWTCGKWNKMVMAHGCYWAKCAFCDTTLDYICRYDAPKAQLVVDRMEQIMGQTGQTGFHFTDEALPPRLLREVSEKIIKRRLTLSFWGNIRFEKAYTPELCDLLSQAGCIAVSGGLEVASDRLLKLMNKGVTIQQTALAAYNLTQAGIMVHTYLMYGFPTETLQETINALDVVRQMFDQGLVQSAFWHRYAMTQHSQSGQHPDLFGVRRTTLDYNPFANNEVDFEETRSYDIDAVGEGLNLATYNYMHGIGLDEPLHRWFSIRTPKPQKIDILK